MLNERLGPFLIALAPRAMPARLADLNGETFEPFASRKLGRPLAAMQAEVPSLHRVRFSHPYRVWITSGGTRTDGSRQPGPDEMKKISIIDSTFHGEARTHEGTAKTCTDQNRPPLLRSQSTTAGASMGRASPCGPFPCPGDLRTETCFYQASTVISAWRSIKFLSWPVFARTFSLRSTTWRCCDFLRMNAAASRSCRRSSFVTDWNQVSSSRMSGYATSPKAFTPSCCNADFQILCSRNF
jgi:hypothetical protein